MVHTHKQNILLYTCFFRLKTTRTPVIQLDDDEQSEEQREVLQELQTNMQLGLSAVEVGTTPRLQGRARLMDKQKLEAAWQLAASLSESLMKENEAVVVVSSEEEEAPRVFDHDEEVDQEFFEMNRRLHRKCIYIHIYKLIKAPVHIAHK